MVLAGDLTYKGSNYYLILNSTSKENRWYLLSRFSKRDRVNIQFGDQLQDEEIRTVNEIKQKHITTDYILESMSIDKLASNVQVYGNLEVLPDIIRLFREANDYIFKKENIMTYDISYVSSKKQVTKVAMDSNLYLSYVTLDRAYRRLEIAYKVMEFSLEKQSIKLSKFNGDYMGLPDNFNRIKEVNGLNLQDLTMQTDLSWYLTKDGKYLKNYRTVKTIEDFEKYVIDEIVKEYHACVSRGEKLVLSIDTETTGLNICYLSEDNPNKDHIVATPMAWKDNEAVVIFNAMKHFENVPKEYMFARLKDLVEDTEIVDLNKNRTERMTLFGELQENDYILERKNILVIGHNVMYDGKVFYDNGVQPEWDEDTLQMAFDLNPKVGKIPITTLEYDEIINADGEKIKINPHLVVNKGGVGLKNLTRRFFGHETPELADLLGKGNEGKYNELSDEEVAKLYGCADGDYTRLVFKRLRSLMSDDMYMKYKRQDVPMLNRLYVSEYYGLLMDEEEVKKLGKIAEDDMNIIHDFLEHYVGHLIEIKNNVLPFEIMLKRGDIDKKTYDECISEVTRKESTSIFEFPMKSSGYIQVLYEQLEYPIIAYTENADVSKRKPKCDKVVMKKLMSIPSKGNTKQLNSDIISSDGKTVLIEADKFNNLMYPVAYALSEYSRIEKEFTSYFKPIMKNNMEGRLFKGYSLSRIETRRIMNPSQTMKGELKAITLPFDGGKDWYMVDFDMAQVEYRIMVSIAGQLEMVDRLRDPEKDFHTESAAMLSNTPPHLINKKFRKRMKSIHFGIPYGLSRRSLCERMFTKITDTNMVKTNNLYEAFASKNDKVMNMLEHHRKEALKPKTFSYDFKKFAGFAVGEKDEATGELKEKVCEVGWVQNLMGFYRLFDVTDLDKRRIGIIERAAGNYPIQAFAAELFRIILLRFYDRCKKEGIADKVVWHMLIHDELLMSVHKSVNPFLIYKIIYEECMITIKNHTNYYVGINIGDNWHDCKDDANEAPVIFVQRMIKRWDAGEFKNDTWVDDPKGYISGYMREFFKTRIGEVIKELEPNIDTEPIDIDLIYKDMSNYTVRAYVTDFFVPQNFLKPNGSPIGDWEDLKDAGKLRYSVSEWAMQVFGEDKLLKDYDGTLKTVKQIIDEKEVKQINLEELLGTSNNVLDFDDMGLDFEEEALKEGWDLADEDQLEEYLECLYFGERKEDFNEIEKSKVFEYDFSKQGDSVTDLLIMEEKELKHISKIKNQLIIKVPRRHQIIKVKEYLLKYKSTSGHRVVFRFGAMSTERWILVDKKINLVELNSYIENEVIN